MSSRIKDLLGRLSIKTKKDWVIFWIFALFVVYALAGDIGFRINDILRGFGNVWLTNLNEPQSYGRLFVTTVIIGVLAEIVLFVCHKPVKAKIVALIAGVAAPILVVGLYLLHCRLIVSVLWEEEPQNVWADFGVERICLKMGEENTGYEEEWEEVLALCRSLTPVSREEQELAMEWYMNVEEPFLGTPMVELYFTEKYGHSYSFQLRIHEGYVYLWRGYSENGLEITFFEDNGITEWLNNLKE